MFMDGILSATVSTNPYSQRHRTLHAHYRLLMLIHHQGDCLASSHQHAKHERRDPRLHLSASIINHPSASIIKQHLKPVSSQLKLQS